MGFSFCNDLKSKMVNSEYKNRKIQDKQKKKCVCLDYIHWILLCVLILWHNYNNNNVWFNNNQMRLSSAIYGLWLCNVNKPFSIIFLIKLHKGKTRPAHIMCSSIHVQQMIYVIAITVYGIDLYLF